MRCNASVRVMKFLFAANNDGHYAEARSPVVQISPDEFLSLAKPPNRVAKILKYLNVCFAQRSSKALSVMRKLIC